MATCACKSAIRENNVDTFRPVDFGKNLIPSHGQVVGVLDIENAVLQVALNQPIHPVQRFDVMVVRFPEWRNGESSAKVYDSPYVSRATKRQNAIDGICVPPTEGMSIEPASIRKRCVFRAVWGRRLGKRESCE